MVDSKFTTVQNTENIPFTAGYRLVAVENLPQWIVRFARLGMEGYIKSFDKIRENKKIYDFISSDDFARVGAKSVDVFPSIETLLKYPDFDVESYTLVLINGKYCADLSDEDDLPFSVFSDGIGLSVSDDEEFLKDKLICDANPYVALNSAYFSSGVVIDVGDGEKLCKPIHIISITTTAGDKIFTNPRVFVRLGNDASVDLVESNLSLDDEKYFDNKVVQLSVGKNSVLNHYKFYNVSQKSAVVENNFIDVSAGSRVNEVCFVRRAGIMSVKSQFNIDERAEVKSVSSVNSMVGSDVDVDVLLCHNGENSDSNVCLYSVVSGGAKTFFKTNVDCRPLVCGVNTSQVSRILLADSTAVGRIKPFQTIEAEKVRAFHGAVVSGVSEEDLFFLQSRGIDEGDAKQLIYRSCLANILQNVKDEKFYDEFLRLLWL